MTVAVTARWINRKVARGCRFECGFGRIGSEKQLIVPTDNPGDSQYFLSRSGQAREFGYIEEVIDDFSIRRRFSGIDVGL